MAPVADALAGRAGVRFALLNDRANDAAVAEFARRGLAATSMREIEPTLASNSIIVVPNDWWPKQIAEFLRRAHAIGATSVGFVEGARFLWPGKYSVVEHVLAFGPSSIGFFKQPTWIVGSLAIETAFHDTATKVSSNLVCINYKLIDMDLNTRIHWFGSVTAACEQLGLPYAVSRHPSDLAPHVDVEFEEIDSLLRRAAVLVTRPSTTVYEALARGKAVVLYPFVGEEPCEFADPMGAFSVAYDPDQLRAMIGQAIATLEGQRARSQAFLERHVAIGPPGSAVRRAAAALLEIAEGRGRTASAAPATMDIARSG
jgi:hypothetical protein